MSINGRLIKILYVHKKGHPKATRKKKKAEDALYVELWEERQLKAERGRGGQLSLSLRSPWST